MTKLMVVMFPARSVTMSSYVPSAETIDPLVNGTVFRGRTSFIKCDGAIRIIVHAIFHARDFGVGLIDDEINGRDVSGKVCNYEFIGSFSRDRRSTGKWNGVKSRTVPSSNVMVRSVL
jgi:hypothetical protein